MKLYMLRVLYFLSEWLSFAYPTPNFNFSKGDNVSLGTPPWKVLAGWNKVGFD